MRVTQVTSQTVDVAVEAERVPVGAVERLPIIASRVEQVLRRGEENATTLAATLRRIWAWQQGDYKFKGRQAPTTSECAALQTPYARPRSEPLNHCVRLRTHVAAPTPWL